VQAVSDLGIRTLDLSAVPTGRVEALARYAVAARAQSIARMSDDRRLATLLAFARRLETAANDDAIDVLDALIGTLLARVERLGQRERLRTLASLDTAARRLRDVCVLGERDKAGGYAADSWVVLVPTNAGYQRWK